AVLSREERLGSPALAADRDVQRGAVLQADADLRAAPTDGLERTAVLDAGEGLERELLGQGRGRREQKEDARQREPPPAPALRHYRPASGQVARLARRGQNGGPQRPLGVDLLALRDGEPDRHVREAV